MSSPYASARRKWAWAEKHRDLLKADFKRIEQFQADPSTLKFDRDPDADRVRGSRKLVTATVRLGDDFPRISDDFPLILGDAIHGYRTALDHAAWELVGLFNRTLDPKKARFVQFPMHDSPRRFDEMKEVRTPGVPDRPERALLKRYQPYRRGDRPQAIGWLQRFSDQDKHRELIATVMAPQGILLKAQSLVPTAKVVGYQALVTDARALYPGTPIAEITISVPRDKKTEIEVKVDLQFTLFPALRRRQNAGGLLGRISTATVAIIDGLAALR